MTQTIGILFTSWYYLAMTALLCLPLYFAVGFCLSHTVKFKSEHRFSVATIALSVPIALLLTYLYIFTLPPADSMDNESPCHDTRTDYEC